MDKLASAKPPPMARVGLRKADSIHTSLMTPSQSPMDRLFRVSSFHLLCGTLHILTLYSPYHLHKAHFLYRAPNPIALDADFLRCKATSDHYGLVLQPLRICKKCPMCPISDTCFAFWTGFSPSCNLPVLLNKSWLSLSVRNSLGCVL